MIKDLTEFRIYAAVRSGGTSRDEIKELVVRIIREHNIEGEVLDFGAGTGELLKNLDRFSSLKLHGADIMARPDDLPQRVSWYQQDLNYDFSAFSEYFDAVVCSEVIEHLENPRATFRN